MSDSSTIVVIYPDWKMLADMGALAAMGVMLYGQVLASRPEVYAKACEVPIAEAESDEGALAYLYSALNVGELHNQLQIRSMSVGDLAVIRSRAYVVQAVGFRRVDAEAAPILAKLGIAQAT
jgi:hypothetical protein